MSGAESPIVVDSSALDELHLIVETGRRIVVVETIISEACRNDPVGSEARLRRRLAPLLPVLDRVDYVPGLNVLIQLEHRYSTSPPLIDSYHCE